MTTLPSVRRSSVATLTIAIAAVSALLQAGAQLFAVTVIVRTVTAAPPRSLTMLAGEYGYDSGPFWDVMPTVTLVLLVVAAVANWRAPQRRVVLVALAAFILAGVFTGLVAGPLQSEVTSTAFADSIDPALLARASRWYLLDWISWALAMIPGLLLVLSLATTRPQPPRTSGPAASSPHGT